MLIPGNGPRIHGTPTIVGEGPSYWEHEAGYPFAGKSGRILDTYCFVNSLPRHRLFVTNVFPKWLGRVHPDSREDKKPTHEQIRKYEHILRRDLETVRPRFILACGRYACEWFLGSDFPSLEVAHGLPFLWSYPDGHGDAWVIAAYHPAAGMRNPENAAKCFHDVKQFALYVRGEITPHERKDPCPERQYSRKPSLLITGSDPAVDTEGYLHRPHCLSYSTRTGEGFVVLASDIKKGDWLPEGSIFHHLMHDMPIVEKMGVKFRRKFTWDYYGKTQYPLHDTMLMAKLLGEPAGLKEGAFRHCAMEMSEYESVIGPYYRRACLEYLVEAADRKWGKSKPRRIFDKKTGKKRLYRPHAIGTRLESILTALASGKKINLRDRWDKLGPDIRKRVVRKCGSFPESHPSLAPESKLIPYACEDADGTRRLKSIYWPRIQAMGLEEAYKTDINAIPMFAAMSTNGMTIDLDHFAKIRPEVVKARDDAARAWLKKWNRGRYFNLASGDLMAKFLYETVGLKPIKWTDGGTTKAPRPKVDENTLELLKDQHDSIPEYIAWKKLHTNVTFIDRIPKHAVMVRDEEDGLEYPTIFCKINTQGTITGRPSTSEPNLLNIPVRTKIGRRIREAFVAREGRILLSCDYSQIELRIGAHLSQDKEMLRAFRRGEDLHEKTAQALGISRYIAKTINFGIFYGMSWVRLRAELLEAGIDKSERECRHIIAEWFRLYSGVRSWLENLFSEVRRHGFVRGLSGRIRALPNIYLDARDPLRSEAERHAGNYPIQEGNAYFTKRAMRRIQEWLIANPEVKVQPLMQIYDELLFSIPDGQEDIAPVITRLMTQDQPLLSVPLKVEAKIGYDWGTMVKAA